MFKHFLKTGCKKKKDLLKVAEHTLDLDLDHSTHVTLLCLHCVTCGYLLLIAQNNLYCQMIIK